VYKVVMGALDPKVNQVQTVVMVQQAQLGLRDKKENPQVPIIGFTP
jgi:hypothetical protein